MLAGKGSKNEGFKSGLYETLMRMMEHSTHGILTQNEVYEGKTEQTGLAA